MRVARSTHPATCLINESLHPVLKPWLCCDVRVCPAPCAGQAEKVAGKFVARRIKPALQRAREKELGQVLSESGQYLRGLWARLNGGGGRRPRALPPALVQPPSSKKDVERVSLAGRAPLSSSYH
jgi:hypothetical protein